MQNVVARSIDEVELKIVAHRISEVLWIKQFREELKTTSPSPMKFSFAIIMFLLP